MKIIAVIPARYASTRFPAKLMQDLCGKTVILRTYEAAVKTNLFDDVFVVTDSDLIFDEIVLNGGKAIRSVKEHESGSDRIAEAVFGMEVDLVINVQGDEPFIDKKPLEELIHIFKKDTAKEVDLGSLMFEYRSTRFCLIFFPFGYPLSKRRASWCSLYEAHRYLCLSERSFARFLQVAHVVTRSV
jgi:3-deoxy-manno-octulosonate cytidylyltransferase (CMP-KDO synthetase)